MWVIVSVVEEGTMALTQQLSHLTDLGSSPPSTLGSYNPFIQQRSHSAHFQVSMYIAIIIQFRKLYTNIMYDSNYPKKKGNIKLC